MPAKHPARGKARFFIRQARMQDCLDRSSTAPFMAPKGLINEQPQASQQPQKLRTRQFTTRNHDVSRSHPTNSKHYIASIVAKVDKGAAHDSKHLVFTLNQRHSTSATKEGACHHSCDLLTIFNSLRQQIPTRDIPSRFHSIQITWVRIHLDTMGMQVHLRYDSDLFYAHIWTCRIEGDGLWVTYSRFTGNQTRSSI